MSERLYSLLLQLYPRAFRERYGEEMARVFRDRLRDEPSAPLWIDVLSDAAMSIPRQYLVQGPHPIFPPSAAPLPINTAIVAQGILVTAALGAFAGFLGGAAIVRGVPGISALMNRVPGGWLLPGALFIVWLITTRRWWRVSSTIKSVHADVRTDSVTVAYQGVAPLTLRRSDIVGLHDFEKLGRRIQTADPARDLWVPARTDAYAHVRAGLSQWAPLTVTPFRFVLKGPSIVLIALLLAVGLLIPVKLVPGIAGVVISQVVVALSKSDVSLFRKLVPLGALLILLVRWLW